MFHCMCAVYIRINTYICSFTYYCGMFSLYFTAFPTAQWETTGSDVTDARLGFSVVIMCDPPSTAVPTPTVAWESKLSTAGDDAYATITTAPLNNTNPSMRFQLTPEGDLIIHKLESADFDRTYRCSVTNANVHTTVASGRTHTLNQGMYVRTCVHTYVCDVYEVFLQSRA